MLHTTFNRLKLAEIYGQRRGSGEGYDKLATHLGGVISYGEDTLIPLDVVVESNGLLDALWCLCATMEDFATVVRPLIRDYLADILEHLADRISAETKSLLADAAASAYRATNVAVDAFATYLAADAATAARAVATFTTAYDAYYVAELEWQTEQFLSALRGE